MIWGQAKSRRCWVEKNGVLDARQDTAKHCEAQNTRRQEKDLLRLIPNSHLLHTVSIKTLDALYQQ
jgi:hypothetical protein